MPATITPKEIATILVVDHDSPGRDLLCQSFEKAGYRAIGAEDAPSALLLLREDLYDLIVLDLDMPGVDGLALCRLLRAQPATSKLPVIALSSQEVDSQKVEALAAGADDYITKSSSAGDIVSRSASHLRAAQREWALIGSNRELRFLADLGRGLLRALEPEQLVRRVAGATYEGTSAVLCAAFVKLNDVSDAACVFDREGSAEGPSNLHVD
ncbi:MAG TPA: response regulator, partial [Pyrinomonadaceae bacterium]|nr:response regulator [Pyrinomonadaceae bacterium]